MLRASLYCLKLASALAFPEIVLGPVDNPPCNRQRPLAIALHRHGVPRRVLAPQSFLARPGMVI